MLGMVGGEGAILHEGLDLFTEEEVDVAVPAAEEEVRSERGQQGRRGRREQEGFEGWEGIMYELFCPSGPNTLVLGFSDWKCRWSPKSVWFQYFRWRY